MKRITFNVALMVSIFFSSCNDEIDTIVSSVAIGEEQEEDVSHQISKEEALQSLYAYLSEDNGNLKTLNVSIDTTEMWSVKYNTIAGNKSLQKSENLVYVANFTDEQGYAILSADDRINEEVLVIADNGSLSQNVVTSAVTQLNEERCIFDEYPLIGDGFFTIPEYSDEVFMNPNTVSLYDDEEDDTLVGLYSEDNIGEEDENGELITTANKKAMAKIDEPELAIGLSLKYAQSQVEAQRLKKTDDLDDSKTSISIRTEKTTSAWKDSGVKSPIILSYYKNWHQHSPFNDLYPRRRKFIVFGHRRKVPAGCFPLAIAKIMTLYSRPSTFSFNGYSVNWASLKSANGYTTTEGKKSAATLLYGISEWCHSRYFYQGTFTFPHRAISFMKDMGFKNVDKYDYKFSRVKDMIDKGNPVIIYAMPKLKVTDSHAWNIDGYKTKTRTITTKTYKGNTLTKIETKTETREMVHCDFGWEGKCNGYYVSGIFKLNSSENDYDPGSGTKNTRYNNFIKIITYNR